MARTRKTHIPVTAGYYEDLYFRPGPADDAYPVVALEDPAVRLGMPTCWDEWFPEVARAYALGGAQVLAYPTAIGSEPDHPEFDTQPLWQHTIIAHAIANGLFVVVPNRTGSEGIITFYGSSFIADPYGRVLVRVPRFSEAVLAADLDLHQSSDWLDPFLLLRTRRPLSLRLDASHRSTSPCYAWGGKRTVLCLHQSEGLGEVDRREAPRPRGQAKSGMSRMRDGAISNP